LGQIFIFEFANETSAQAYRSLRFPEFRAGTHWVQIDSSSINDLTPSCNPALGWQIAKITTATKPDDTPMGLSAGMVLLG